MDYFVACEGLGSLAYSSQQESGWHIPEAAEAMHRGDLVYAGKYSAPDMELLTTGHCGLAIENTMILHSPAVIEKLEGVGIPVFIDYASLETTPEGRMEWVRLYGLMSGREAEAVPPGEEIKQMTRRRKHSGGSGGGDAGASPAALGMVIPQSLPGRLSGRRTRPG